MKDEQTIPNPATDVSVEPVLTEPEARCLRDMEACVVDSTIMRVVPATIRRLVALAESTKAKPLVDPAVTLADQFRLLAHAAETGATVYRSDEANGDAELWGKYRQVLVEKPISLSPLKPFNRPPVEVGQYLMHKDGVLWHCMEHNIDRIREIRDDFTLMKLVPDEEKP